MGRAITLFGLVVTLVLGCGGEESKSTGLRMRNVLAKDASGNDLGSVLEADEKSIRLVNSQGYMFRITYDGAFKTENVYYYSTDCSGSAYTDSTESKSYGKEVIACAGTLYVAQTINSDGTPTTTSLNFANKSQRNPSTGECAANGLGSTSSYAELKTVSRAELGIPETITPPITFYRE